MSLTINVIDYIGSEPPRAVNIIRDVLIRLAESTSYSNCLKTLVFKVWPP